MLPGRDETTSSSRRSFLRWLGLAGLVAGASPVAFAAPRAASKPKPTPVPQAPATPPPDTAAAAPAAPARPAPLEPSEDARALAGIIERRYGKQLTKEQLESIARDLEGDLRGGARLRDSKLANSDEPDVTFHA